MGGIVLSLGAFQEGGGNKFYMGLMDDFQAYNTVLTAGDDPVVSTTIPARRLQRSPEPSTIPSRRPRWCRADRACAAGCPKPRRLSRREELCFLRVQVRETIASCSVT